jgi:putative inorganic carbon (HCO3(-)) transporter
VLLAAGVGVTALGILAVRWSQKVPILGAVTTRLPERLVSLPGATQGINPNEIAGVLLWVAPLALALALMLLLKRREFLQNQLQASHIILLVASFLAALTTTGMIVLVQSRSGWLGLAASIAFLVVVFAGRLRRLVIVLGLLALLAAVGAILVLGLERVTGTLISEAAASNPLTTLRGRQEIWQRALYGIQDFPLTGMGMNTFRQVVHVLYPLFLIGPETDIAHAHNHLLQAGLDLGIPGLIAYLAVWIGAAGMLWRAWRRSESLWLRVAAAGLAASLFGYAVFGMLDAVSLGARPGFLFWLLLGLVAALDRLTFPAQSPVVPV